MGQFLRHIESYDHHGRIGVLVEFALESDFTLQTDEFKALARDIALHIAASSPASVDELLQQPFVRDREVLVGQLLSETARQLKEQVSISRFIRWDTEISRPTDFEPPRDPANVVRFDRRA